MIGVNATASRPSSTLSRAISNKFPSVKKFGAIAREEHDLGGERQQQDPFAVRQRALHRSAHRARPAPTCVTAGRSTASIATAPG